MANRIICINVIYNIYPLESILLYIEDIAYRFKVDNVVEICFYSL